MSDWTIDSLPAALRALQPGLSIRPMQLTAIPRGQTNQLENLGLTGNILDDGTNSELLAFVYTAQAAYFRTIS